VTLSGLSYHVRWQGTARKLALETMIGEKMAASPQFLTVASAILLAQHMWVASSRVACGVHAMVTHLGSAMILGVTSLPLQANSTESEV
jgi:predicted phage tail protein